MKTKKNWHEIHSFTGILEQSQIAFFLGPRTTTIFARALMRKITGILSRHLSPDHPLIATKEALQALERVRRAAPTARQGSGRTELVFFCKPSHLLRFTLRTNLSTGAWPSWVSQSYKNRRQFGFVEPPPYNFRC
jgi:hypothetical protein